MRGVKRSLPTRNIAIHLRGCSVWIRILLRTIVAALLAVTLQPLYAGQLILQNVGNQPVVCTVDGFTIQSGALQETQFTVQPNSSIYVMPNIARGEQVINWVNCGQLLARPLAVTPGSANQTLFLNSQQTRVLNVSLYSYLPVLAPTNLETLATYVQQSYQSQNPQVLLNVAMDGSGEGPINIYKFDNLPGYLGASGFDVMELDMMYLGFLVNAGLINQQQLPANSPISVAVNASSINNVLYAIPSWLCMDFIYSDNPAIQQVTSLTALQAFLAPTPNTQTQLVADYTGKWRLPSIYLNAYVQTYNNIQNAFNMPPDRNVIANLVALAGTCVIGGSNLCIDGTYHGASAGTTEQVFSHAASAADVGFSEQSFYTRLAGTTNSLYVAPMPWGPNPQPLLFADSFVTNSTTCQPTSQCGIDAANLITLMTSVQMKTYITTSQDYPKGTPWRTLLVPYASFYSQQDIANNSLYQQYQQVFQTAQPFPNTWTAAQQASMGAQICAALQASLPNYSCNPGQANVAAAAKAKSSGPIVLKQATPAKRRALTPGIKKKPAVRQPVPTPMLVPRSLHERR